MSTGASYSREADQKDSYVSRVARGAGISTVGQGVGRAIGYLTQVAIARLYGASQLGFYTLGVTAAEAGHIVAQLGMDSAVVRYVAHYRANDDPARMRGTIVFAIRVSLILSLLISVALFFGAGLLTNVFFDDPVMTSVFRAFALALPIFTLMSIMLWSTQGFQNVTYAAWVRQMIRPAIGLVLLIAFYFLGAGILGAVAAYGASMAIGAVLALYFLRRLFPPLLDRHAPTQTHPKEMFNFSIPMSVTTATQYINSWSPVWVLGAFAAASSVGILQAAVRTAALAQLVRFAFSGIFAPIISSLHARGSSEDLGAMYKDVSRWVFTGALGFFLLAVLLANDILAIFGAEFAQGKAALILVAAGQLFGASVGPTPRMLAMTENQRAVMVATAISAVTGTVASLALVPFFGIMGAAVGAVVALVTENGATLYAVNRLLGYWPYNRDYLRPISAGAAAAALTFLADRLLDLPTGIASLAAYTALFGVLFVAGLVAVGLTATDREFLASFKEVALRYLGRERR